MIIPFIKKAKLLQMHTLWLANVNYKMKDLTAVDYNISAHIFIAIEVVQNHKVHAADI